MDPKALTLLTRKSIRLTVQYYSIEVFWPPTEREGQHKQWLNFGQMFWYLGCSCRCQISLEMSCCLFFSYSLCLFLYICLNVSPLSLPLCLWFRLLCLSLPSKAPVAGIFKRRCGHVTMYRKVRQTLIFSHPSHDLIQILIWMQPFKKVKRSTKHPRFDHILIPEQSVFTLHTLMYA